MHTLRQGPRYRELLSNVIQGESMPIAPVAFWRHHPIADQDGVALAESTIAFQRRFDCDFVKITPASSFQLRDYGLTDRWDHDPLGRRTLGPGPVESPQHWWSLPKLDPHTGFLARYLECAVRVRSALPAHIPVVQTVFNPVFQATALSTGGLPHHLHTAPEAVRAGLTRIAENTVALISALRDCGIDGVFLASQHVNAESMPEAVYADWALPFDRDCIVAAEGLPFNMLHLHGQRPHLRLANRFGVDLVHFAAPDDLLPSQAFRSSRVALSTGLLGSDLLSTEPDHVFRRTEQLLDRWKGPHFVLAAGCVVPLGAPDQNIDAAIACARTPRPDRLRLAECA